MKLLIAMMLLVCGQTIAQRVKYDVPVNITLKGADTTKTFLYRLIATSDTTADVYFESMTYLQYASHNKYFTEIPKDAFYLIVFTFPDNSHIELFVQTSDKSTSPIDIIVNKNALITRNVYYNKTTSSYYYKEEPRSKKFFELAKKLKW
jgi:hypothetical protein